MDLYIKNMICDRCILVVKQELDKLNLVAASIKLGEVKLAKEPNERQLAQLKERLAAVGFELLTQRKS